MAAEVVETPIDGVVELVSQPFSDPRGSFLNGFRQRDESFARAWGDRPIQQVNLSRNSWAGTLRGLHLQRAPHSEAKLVRCLRGRVWDVAVDLRLGSTSYGHWHAVQLSPEGGNALLIPEGCAHGFQVLADDTELLYLHGGHWEPDSETGVRFNDPQLAIPWPLPPRELSARDLALPLLESPS
jgi:dTDP-4-dehydrorhamnose 3,5-epimerase